MLASDAATAAATWRPQLFGDKRAATIKDPIVEPLWTGPRILALVDRGTVRLTDAEGEPVEENGVDNLADIIAALGAAMAGGTALFEAYLTPEPIQAPAEIAARDSVTLQKPGQAMTQMVFGSRGDRKDRLLARQEEARQRTVVGTADRLAIVAVDLLWLDDESLCEIPLLERKRILESVLPESDLVRVGIHVKPPVDTWLGSWRSMGFHRLAYKNANSRYLPGQKNQEWATAEIPPR
jgi:hypothetical protein